MERDVVGHNKSHCNRICIEKVREKNSIVDLVYSSPFRILPMKDPKSGAPASMMLSHYGGGMLQGDEVTFDIVLKEGCEAKILSQANSQVLPSEDGRTSHFAMNGTLDANTTVVVKCEPVVLHKNARYMQTQKWKLASSSRLVLVDWMQSGRSDSGEKYLFHSYQSSLDICVDNKPVLYENFVTEPSCSSPYGSATFMGYDHYFTLYCIGNFGSQAPIELTPLEENHRVAPLVDSKERDISERPDIVIHMHKLASGDGWIYRGCAKTRSDFDSFFLSFESMDWFA